MSAGALAAGPLLCAPLMHNRRFVVLALLIATGACTTADSAPSATTAVETTTTTALTATTTSGVPAVCAPLAEVVEASDEMGLRMSALLLELFEQIESSSDTDVGPEAEAQALADFKDVMLETDPIIDEIVGRYGAALVVAPDDLLADLEALRDATIAIWPLMLQAIESAESFQEFGELFRESMADPDLQAVTLDGGTAALRLDQFTVPECGFKLSNG